MKIIPLGRRPSPKTDDLASRPPAGRPSRSRHELVGWIALGLVVAVVLSVVSRSSVLSGTTHAYRPSEAAKIRATPADGLRNARSATTRRQAPAPTTKNASVKSTHRRTEKPVVSEPSPSVLTIDSTTPTTALKAPRAQVDAPLIFSGTLGYPNDLASTLPFSSSSGIAAVRISWTGGSELDARLHCRGTTTSAPGAHGISLSVSGSPGPCAVTVSLAPGTRTTVPFSLDINAPSAASR